MLPWGRKLPLIVIMAMWWKMVLGDGFTVVPIKSE
jgi:hypothetical protein